MSASPYRGIDVVQLWANVAASQTDQVLLNGDTGNRVRVLALAAEAAGTATDLTINTKPSGSGTAISPLFPLGVRTPLVLPFNAHGWFETDPNHGLSATTGAGSTVALLITAVVFGAGAATTELLDESASGESILLEDGSAFLLEAA